MTLHFHVLSTLPENHDLLEYGQTTLYQNFLYDLYPVLYLSLIHILPDCFLLCPVCYEFHGGALHRFVVFVCRFSSIWVENRCSFSQASPDVYKRQEYTYDDLGRRTGVTDAAGETTSVCYNEIGNVDRICLLYTS